ncbi:LTA synthase family protein [Desulfuromonas sp. AOP6]|uniref:LTA synthase family protein n=1 Tax=Desulfuromonas sp. AOP6 TaxID=1566351 RepID=UPI00126DBC9E|nr:LTA synthase family protein [Desulfuromonas sp. AOP6]BCA80105.1 alkaline phosphatase [Desulfuromonas sp. AOP6]
MVKQVSSPLRAVLFSVGVFSILRLGYWATYPAYFEKLSPIEIFKAFAVGWRFDLSITVAAGSIFFLALVLPFPIVDTPRLQKVSLWSLFSFLSVLWIVNIADLFYFGEVYRHVGREILLLKHDWGMLIELALQSRLTEMALACLALLGLAFLWHALVVRPASAPPADSSFSWRRSFSYTVFMLLLLLLGARGGLVQGKPISMVDAYMAGNEKQASLALNGAFSLVHSIRLGLKKSYDSSQSLTYLSPQELNLWQAQFVEDKGEDPFIRILSDDNTPENKNIVIVLLESWSYRYIDGLAGSDYGATPFIDSLIPKARVWDNTFAAGQRSIEGIQAVLTSVPVLESQPIIGWGQELNRMTRLAALLGERGYHSVMVQSSNRRSFHLDSIAAALGFNAYFGKEDLPIRRQYPGEVPRFGWDFEALMFMADYLASPKVKHQPFLSFVFTGTTHEPFPDPGREFHLYPHHAGKEEAYLNTLRYSDWSLQQFMAKAAEQPWYKNTVFVFIADHVLRSEGTSLESEFEIPLIIYTPDGSIEPGRDSRYASQYDVLPTLMTLLDVPDNLATYGKSLLLPAGDLEGAQVQRGGVTGWIDSKGWFTFSRHTDLDSGGLYEHDLDTLAQNSKAVKARMQVADHRLSRNLWFPEPKGKSYVKTEKNDDGTDQRI